MERLYGIKIRLKLGTEISVGENIDEFAPTAEFGPP